MTDRLWSLPRRSMYDRSIILAAVAAAMWSADGISQTRANSQWPGLWGPARNGIVEGTGAPIGSLRELWRRPSSGGYSEVAAAGDTVVTLELRGAEDFVIALDASTGRQRWATRLGPTYRGHGGSDDGPISTPAIDGDDVFALGPHGQLVALSARDGRERWRHDLPKAFGAGAPTWGFAASPLVEGRLVIVPTGGPNSRGLLALDRATGKMVWNAPLARTTDYSSAVPAVVAMPPPGASVGASGRAKAR